MSAVVEVRWLMTRLLAFWWVIVLCCSDGGMCSGWTETKEASNFCTEIDTVYLDLR